MKLSSILGLPLGLMTGAQFLTLMAEALKDRRQPEAQAATVNDFSDEQRYIISIKTSIFLCNTSILYQS